RDHRRLGLRRGSQENLSARLEGPAALYPHRSAAEDLTGNRLWLPALRLPQAGALRLAAFRICRPVFSVASRSPMRRSVRLCRAGADRTALKFAGCQHGGCTVDPAGFLRLRRRLLSQHARLRGPGLQSRRALFRPANVRLRQDCGRARLSGVPDSMARRLPDGARVLARILARLGAPAGGSAAASRGRWRPRFLASRAGRAAALAIARGKTHGFARPRRESYLGGRITTAARTKRLPAKVLPLAGRLL